MTMTSADMASSESSSPDRGGRRSFTREYKLRIVAEYEAATERGARGGLLRREGLYDSHIVKWRAARDAGRLAPAGTTPPARAAAAERENARLRAQLATTTAELESTKAVVEIMGKVHGLLQTICDRQEPPTR